MYLHSCLKIECIYTLMIMPHYFITRTILVIILKSGSQLYENIRTLFNLFRILLALWVILCLYFAFHYLVSIKRYFRIKQSSNISRLYTSLRTILIWGYLYVEYRPERVEYALYEFFTMFSN